MWDSNHRILATPWIDYFLWHDRLAMPIVLFKPFQCQGCIYIIVCVCAYIYICVCTYVFVCVLLYGLDVYVSMQCMCMCRTGSKLFFSREAGIFHLPLFWILYEFIYVQLCKYIYIYVCVFIRVWIYTWFVLHFT